MRRTLGIIALLSLLVADYGLLPVRLAAPKAREQFPCRTHACTCLTAEHCWTACTCFTLDQKLHWAERNSVASALIAKARAVAAQMQAEQDLPPCCRSGGHAAADATDDLADWSAPPNHLPAIGSATCGTLTMWLLAAGYIAPRPECLMTLAPLRARDCIAPSGARLLPIHADEVPTPPPRNV